MTTDSKNCPHCNELISPDSPGGLCPKCLVAGAIPPLLPGEEPSGSKAQEAPLSAGELDAILPDYSVQEIIGSGGMGVVYRAVQENLNREVAIKVMPKALAEDPAFAERFSREARALAALNHPNIVTVHDTGTVEGVCYIVMELVDGANLREVLAAGKLQPGEALLIVTQVCAALQFAHDSGIVHRDIKPDNILLTPDGHVKITDFGLVKLVGERDIQVTLTNTKEAMGTMRYMAPEQLVGAGDADHRADIYSLGVVFYELLTGEVPAGRFDPPSKSVEIDVRLDEVVMRALDAKPERRYQQASEVSSEVEQISATPGVVAAAVSAPAESMKAKQESKLSKKAVVGVVWAPLFVIPAAFIAVTFYLSRSASVGGSSSGSSSGGSIGLIELIIIIILGFPFFLAPIGTTVLGWSAIRDIKASNGAIYGLRLAFFDAIFFPLLGVIAAAMISAMALFGPDEVKIAGVLVMLLSAVIVWQAWKKVSAKS